MGIKEQLVGLNNFLTDIYNIETRLSTILANLGFNSKQIEDLRREHIEIIVNNFISWLRDRILSSKDGERLFFIINRRYGLNGNPIETLRNIGVDLGISHERVRQLEKKAIRRSRHRAYLTFWETSLRELAIKLLSNPK